MKMGFNTFPKNPFPPNSEDYGGGGSTYELPTASADTLGGVKVGTGLSIEDGVLSNDNATPYTLPTASADTLGGVKVGTGLSIEDGVLSNDNATPYSPPNYSTNEVDTGVKWIDGKNIFRKVYNNIELTNNTTVSIESDFASSKNVLNMYGVFTAIDTGGTQVIEASSFVAQGNTLVYPRILNGDLKVVVAGDMHEFTGFVVVEYTKNEL